MTDTDAPTTKRIWAKVRKSDGCWLWTAGLSSDGYGRVYMEGQWRGAHRVVYELVVGAVPDGLELDHLCRTPACVRPDHLEPVTHAENVRRGRGADRHRFKTHCDHGHAFDAENTRYRAGRLHRECRQCDRDKKRRARAAA